MATTQERPYCLTSTGHLSREIQGKNGTWHSQLLWLMACKHPYLTVPVPRGPHKHPPPAHVDVEQPLTPVGSQFMNRNLKLGQKSSGWNCGVPHVQVAQKEWGQEQEGGRPRGTVLAYPWMQALLRTQLLQQVPLGFKRGLCGLFFQTKNWGLDWLRIRTKFLSVKSPDQLRLGYSAVS
jgi:hypothetical protein